MKRRKLTPDEDLFSLKCSECGRALVSTGSGYLCCPNGHGKLKLASEQTGTLDTPALVDDPCGSWFEEQPLEG